MCITESFLSIQNFPIKHTSAFNHLLTREDERYVYMAETEFFFKTLYLNSVYIISKKTGRKVAVFRLKQLNDL